MGMIRVPRWAPCLLSESGGLIKLERKYFTRLVVHLYISSNMIAMDEMKNELQ